MNQVGFILARIPALFLPMILIKEVIQQLIKKNKPRSHLGLKKCALLWFAVNNTHANLFILIKDNMETKKWIRKVNTFAFAHQCK